MQKIMFNDRFGLTDAVLDGRKTMTRRIIQCPKKAFCFEVGITTRGGCLLSFSNNKGNNVGEIWAKYKIGDVVAIAQNYKTIRDEYLENKVFAKADTLEMETKYSNGWNNKMFTRADIMPHHIKITDIKVERLQDIPEEECLREGIRPCNFGKKFTPGDTRAYNTARQAFASLIDKVGKKGTWASNPWVFCYSFELVD